jgi:hypothetical protein
MANVSIVIFMSLWPVKAFRSASAAMSENSVTFAVPGTPPACLLMTQLGHGERYFVVMHNGVFMLGERERCRRVI